MRITGLSPPVAPLPAAMQALLVAALPEGAAFVPPAVAAELSAAQASAQAATQAPAPAVAQPVSVEMLVTLATVEPAIDRRRRVAIDADRGLDVLERLDATLLAGIAPVAQLEAVAAWSDALHLPQDPELIALLKDIELRVRVELAKHEIVA